MIELLDSALLGTILAVQAYRTWMVKPIAPPDPPDPSLDTALILSELETLNGLTRTMAKANQDLVHALR